MILQDTYYKGEGQIELKYSVRNVAGENFTEEIDGQQMSIVELKVSFSDVCVTFSERFVHCLKSHEPMSLFFQ